MIQLVYTSTATLPMTTDGMKALCEKSRANNLRDEVTGVLASRGNKFLQVLEGPRDSVEEAFLRIVVDSRHHKLQLLSRRVVTKREFGEWELQHCEDVGQVETIFERVAALTRDAPETIQDSFRAFLN